MKRLAALLIGVTGLVLPRAAQSEQAEQPLVENGRIALETRCSRCHAIGLDGESAHPEAPPFRVVVQRYPPENLEEALAEGIDTGHSDMPEFILAPEEIAASIAYLRTLLPKPGG